MYAHGQHIKTHKAQLYSYTLTIETLSTHGTPQDPSQWTKTAIAGAAFIRCVLFFSGSVRSYFGMNGQDAVVLLPSKALKEFIIALQWK